MTHNELVSIAARWLRSTAKCSVVLTELHSMALEIPDAIGWRCGTTHSILVECKASRADFRADRKKHCRRDGFGMGSLRYYLAPAGVLGPEELPQEWGLLEVHGRRVHKVRLALRSTTRGQDDEMRLLLSALRRAQESHAQSTVIASASLVSGESVIPVTRAPDDHSADTPPSGVR